MENNLPFELKRPLTITVANAKGGVGKTTITRYLPYALALRGYKILILDEDPQSNLTKTMILTRKLNKENDDVFIFEKTLMAGIRDGKIDDLIVNVMPNLDIIPSHSDFESFPAFLNKKFGVAEEGDSNWLQIESNKISFVKNLIDPIKSNYDFIFIDTPPTKSDYTKTATFASDYVIIAFQTQSDSLDGAVDFVNLQLTPLVKDFNAQTDVLGILPNQLSNSGAIDLEVLEDAKKIFGDQNLFDHIIPFAKRVQSAPRKGIRQDGYWDGKLFKDIINPLADDFLNRVRIVEDI